MYVRHEDVGIGGQWYPCALDQAAGFMGRELVRLMCECLQGVVARGV